MPYEVDVGHDVRERVVDLVRDPRRQRPHRGHAPGKDQLVLHPPPLGQIANVEVMALGAARGGLRHRHHRDLHVERGSVLARAVDLALDLLRQRPHVGAHQRAIGGGHGHLPAAADDPVLRVAEQAAERPVHRDHAAIRVETTNRLRRVFQRGAQLPHLVLQARDQHIRGPCSGQQRLRGRGPKLRHRARISSANKAREVTFFGRRFCHAPDGPPLSSNERFTSRPPPAASRFWAP